jgi:hypothetical protein
MPSRRWEILSEERGDYKQAQELFQEVLKLDPRNLIANLPTTTRTTRCGNSVVRLQAN